MLIILFSFTLFISAAVFANAYGNKQLCKTPVNDDNNTIIIDPGHGDPDGGAIGIDGVIEKDINLSISLKLKILFQWVGYSVIMTREGDNAIYDNGSNTIRKKKSSDLHNRLAIINSHPKAIFISIHQNIYKSRKSNGSLIFYSPNNISSKGLAQSIQDSIASMLQPQNKRIVSPIKKSIYLLHNAKSPAVLVECGFLSNQSDCKLLENDSYQKKIAFAIFCGILSFKSSKESNTNTERLS